MLLRVLITLLFLENFLGLNQPPLQVHQTAKPFGQIRCTSSTVITITATLYSKTYSMKIRITFRFYNSCYYSYLGSKIFQTLKKSVIT